MDNSNNDKNKVETNFKSGRDRTIKISNESLESAISLVSSVNTTPPKSKRGRDNDNNDNDNNNNNNNNNNEQKFTIENFKINKYDNKESTGFRTASDLPIRVSKEAFNSEKSKIDLELQKEIDLKKYEADLSLLDQPLVKKDE